MAPVQRAWPYGQCRYCHCCEKCEGEHPSINCPFWASTSPAQPSWSSTPPRKKTPAALRPWPGSPPLQWTMYSYVVHFHLHIVCFPFLIMLLCLLHKIRQRAAGIRKSPFPVCTWLALRFSKILSFLQGLPPLMLKNFGVDSVFTLIKSKWIMWLQGLQVVFFLVLIPLWCFLSLQSIIYLQHPFSHQWLISTYFQSSRKVM